MALADHRQLTNNLTIPAWARTRCSTTSPHSWAYVRRVSASMRSRSAPCRDRSPRYQARWSTHAAPSRSNTVPRTVPCSARSRCPTASAASIASAASSRASLRARQRSGRSHSLSELIVYIEWGGHLLTMALPHFYNNCINLWQAQYVYEPGLHCVTHQRSIQPELGRGTAERSAPRPVPCRLRPWYGLRLNERAVSASVELDLGRFW